MGIEEKEKSATTGNSGRPILKTFRIKDGWFIVETETSELGNIMFSIRGTAIPTDMGKVLQMANEYFQFLINDNKFSCR